MPPHKRHLSEFPSGSRRSIGPMTYNSSDEEEYEDDEEDEDEDDDDEDDNDATMTDRRIVRRNVMGGSMISYHQRSVQQELHANEMALNWRRSFQPSMDRYAIRSNRENKSLQIRDQRRAIHLESQRQKYRMNHNLNVNMNRLRSKGWSELVNNQQLVTYWIGIYGVDPSSIFPELPQLNAIRSSTWSLYEYNPEILLERCITDGVTAKPLGGRLGYVFVPIPENASADKYHDYVENKCAGFISTNRNEWMFGISNVCGISGFIIRISQNDYESKKEAITKFIAQFHHSVKPWIIGSKRNMELIRNGSFNDEMKDGKK
eukprot:CAMPEP_0201567128 /NCGR_PEP_ID=MMETSP0190_2-20130828/7433_1 /ASSEMBLY_ACC=CAM_ASM_000263 /TAXON_ID=37353 /ORGANISM="Rosalina sp." /LENGTH=317 /DNA_ID=CAMNT_0047986729 /DNA_START=684 /DNA_END=1638 /DNA_ORIENTATION=-